MFSSGYTVTYPGSPVQHNQCTQTQLCLVLPSGPPSAPENPISTVNETCVTLEWSPPRDTGGRGDITYSLHCRKCIGDGKKCTPCGSSVHFVPRQFGLSSATVLVTDLQPDSNYSFTIESQNGVSDLSPTPRGTVVINITTSQTGECCDKYKNKHIRWLKSQLKNINQSIRLNMYSTCHTSLCNTKCFT